MLLGDLAADIVPPSGVGAIEIKGLAVDSRAVGRDFLFAALPGSTVDGAAYVADAVKRGATAILAGTTAAIDAPPEVVVLRAEDPRRAIALLAARFHPRQPGELVAVTGTSGKTSVVAFARQIFAIAGNEAASLGTLGVVSRR